MQNSKKELILSALLTNPTVREAAEACGVPEQTIYKYLRENEAFRKEYEERKKAIVSDATSYMQARMGEAVKTIIEIMTNKELSPQIRLNASQMLLTFTHRFTEQKEIIERLEALESAMEVE